MARRKSGASRAKAPKKSIAEESTQPRESAASVEASKELLAAKRELEQSRGQSLVVKAARAVLQIEPTDAYALRRLGEVQVARGSTEAAVATFDRALKTDPDNEVLLQHYVVQAAKADSLWEALCAARHWVSVAQTKPVGAVRILAGLYGLLGLEDTSQQWAREAARIEPMTVVQSSGETRLRILALGTIASGTYRYRPKQGGLSTAEGHNNLAQMLDAQAITRYHFSVDRLDDHPEQLDKIPEVDLIYNGITDASRCEEALNKAQWLCERMNLPVINPPSEVLRTTREENSERLGSAEGVLVPRSIPLGRLEGDIGDQISAAVAEHGLEIPIIMRAAGFQNGRNMHLIEKPDNIKVRLAEPAEVYLLQYHDVSYVDSRAPEYRLYPKYRAFMVGGKLYPIHLRVGHDGEWNVHIHESNRTFQKCPWLFDDEQDFIENPSEHLESGCWERLEKTLQRIELDYFGVDFAICTDPRHKGDVVIFEANASMRSFLVDTHENTPENDAAYRVIMAVHQHFCDRAGVPQWEFALPRGKPSPAVDEGFAESEAPFCMRHILFSGRVQNLGFREWFRHELHRHALSGWVRNLTDGRVEAVIAGPEDAVAFLLEHLQGPDNAKIVKREVSDWQGARPENRVRILDTAETPAYEPQNVDETTGT